MIQVKYWANLGTFSAQSLFVQISQFARVLNPFSLILTFPLPFSFFLFSPLIETFLITSPFPFSDQPSTTTPLSSMRQTATIVVFVIVSRAKPRSLTPSPSTVCENGVKVVRPFPLLLCALPFAINFIVGKS